VCVRVSALLEKKKRKRRVTAAAATSLVYCPSLLVESLVVVGFKKRNVTLSLVPSTVHNCFCCVCLSALSQFSETRTHTYTQTAQKKKPYRSLLCWGAVYITGSSFLCRYPLLVRYTHESNNAISQLENATSISSSFFPVHFSLTGILVAQRPFLLFV
jgi:hypothetical protein